MGKLMIINGSPRAPKSNSRHYIQAFLSGWSGPYEQYSVVEKKHASCLERLEQCSDLLLVFPLYTDALPSGLMEFLQAALAQPPANKPKVHLVINCGFLEPEQNDVAVDMIRLFCERTGCPFVSCLRIGGGEGFPSTPFMGMVRRRLKKLAAAISRGRPIQMKVSMPLTKGLFRKAANRYWLSRGQAFGVTQAQMSSLEIEGR